MKKTLQYLALAGLLTLSGCQGGCGIGIHVKIDSRTNSPPTTNSSPKAINNYSQTNNSSISQYSAPKNYRLNVSYQVRNN